MVWESVTRYFFRKAANTTLLLYYNIYCTVLYDIIYIHTQIIYTHTQKR